VGASKALDTFKTRIREQTCRTRGLSLPQIIEGLTPYLIGWRGYFGFCQTPRVLTNLEDDGQRRYVMRHMSQSCRRRHDRPAPLAAVGQEASGFVFIKRRPARGRSLDRRYRLQ
jgi:RNA-directed DNA polymerase